MLNLYDEKNRIKSFCLINPYNSPSNIKLSLGTYTISSPNITIFSMNFLNSLLFSKFFIRESNKVFFSFKSSLTTLSIFSIDIHWYNNKFFQLSLMYPYEHFLPLHIP